MKIFDYLDYRKYVLEELKKRPKKGHGQFLKIAKALHIHTTMVTHILKGHLHFSMEQSLAMAEFLGLNELETEFFIHLVQWERAGNPQTKNYFFKKLSAIKERSQNLRERLETKNTLDDSDRAVYYSTWIYAAIRLLTSIPHFQTREALAERLGMHISRVNQILEFLLSRGLCQEEDGRIFYGDTKTYIGQESLLVSRHHSNWRLKALERIDRVDPQELAYTNPVVLAEKDIAKVREEIVQLIERVHKITAPSPCEKLFCFNIDWLEMK